MCFVLPKTYQNLLSQLHIDFQKWSAHNNRFNWITHMTPRINSVKWLRVVTELKTSDLKNLPCPAFSVSPDEKNSSVHPSSLFLPHLPSRPSRPGNTSSGSINREVGCQRQANTQQLVVVQSLSRVLFFATPWTAARQVPLSFTISEFAQMNFHWVGDALPPSRPSNWHASKQGEKWEVWDLSQRTITPPLHKWTHLPPEEGE